jgi:hypothetical protein
MGIRDREVIERFLKTPKRDDRFAESLRRVTK